MKITVLCVGKIKERYFTMAIEEYQKRLSRYCKLDIIEVPDEKTPDHASPAEEEQIKRKEGDRLLKLMKQGAYVIVLAIEGMQLSSEKLADKLAEIQLGGDSHIYFLIGGSLGLHKEVLAKADMLLSFSKMTFPHQMMRVILLEQIYRAFRIIQNEPYHK